MQRDAFERLDLKRMLTEPEMLEAVQPDVSLVSTLISMRGLLGGRTKETARLVVFDTEVVDLSDAMDDPVEVLFSVQFGDGTDISRAVGYCAARITRPEDTVLISDLYEGGPDRQIGPGPSSEA